MSRTSKTFDASLELKDAGLVASSAPAEVDAAAKILDLGGGLVEGDILVDVSAIEVASRDESYNIGVQISDSATFASAIYEILGLKLGAASSDFCAAVDELTGYDTEYETPVDGHDAVAGYAEISNGGSLAAFTGATVPGLASQNYTIDITIDGTLRKITVALLVTDTWTQICAKIQVALRALTSSTETVAISGSNIRVTSATTGDTSTVVIATGTFGATTVIPGNVDMKDGRYVIPFNNMIKDGTTKRYLRIYTTVAGTVATGINYTAYLARRSDT